jgi:hypothetical protein
MSTSFSHIFKVDILLDITATSGLKFSMHTEFFQEKESSIKRSLLNLKTIFYLKEEPNIRCLYTNALEGHEPSPEALLKKQDYYKSQYNFYFRTEAAMFGFIKKTTISHQK